MTDIRQAIHGAFEAVGGQSYLEALAASGDKDDRKLFIGLLSKTIPKEIKAEIQDARSTDDLSDKALIELVKQGGRWVASDDQATVAAPLPALAATPPPPIPVGQEQDEVPPTPSKFTSATDGTCDNNIPPPPVLKPPPPPVKAAS